MSNASRPLIALLVGTVAFFALWTVALKPSSSSGGSGGSSKGLGAYQSAIDKAHQAVATSNAASATHGGTVPTTASTTAAQPTPGSASKPVVRPASTSHRTPLNSPKQRLNVVERALIAHKTIALLFYNPGASDDLAVKQELAGVSTHGGRVVKLAVPLSELANYAVVTNQVQVATSPTLVLIDRHARATTLTGYADQFTIARLLDDALAAK